MLLASLAPAFNGWVMCQQIELLHLFPVWVDAVCTRSSSNSSHLTDNGHAAFLLRKKWCLQLLFNANTSGVLTNPSYEFEKYLRL